MSRTRFRLLKWKATGFRCPDHEINLMDDQGEPYPISLIQMPNGTGKTTTLALLRAVLSGEAEEWDPQRIQQFRKLEGTAESGYFELTALHDDKRLTFQMTFDFREGRVHYTTTLPLGQRRGFSPPPALRRFLRPGFVNFFVFDGELAEHLMSSSRDDAEAVIQDLFQLRQLNHLSERVQNYYEEQVAGRTALEEKGLVRRRNRVKQLRSRIKQLEVEYSNTHDQLEAVRGQLEVKKRAFDNAVDTQTKERVRLTDAENKARDAKHKVEHLANEALVMMRDPYALSFVFAQEVLDLKQSFDRVKLPESAAREFFDELADEDLCICGRPLDDVSRNAVRDRAQQYLGSEEVSLLNAMKREVSDQIGSEPAVHETRFTMKLEELLDATRSEDQARTDLDAIRDDVAGTRPELKNTRNDISVLDQQVSALQHQLSKYENLSDAAADDDTFGLEVLKRRFKEADRALSEVTETLEIRHKCEVLTRILGNAHNTARRKLSEELCNEANERVKKLMPNNRIRIGKINRYIELSQQEGASVGETLAVAYAFLSTLFNRAEHVLPFVVDSPANPIDLAVRRRIAELIPQLTEQFVAFTISSERAAFLEYLERAAGGIQYITLFRKGLRELETAGRRSSFLETNDGIIVTGREFFHSFHLNDEQEAAG